jgi:hypothetical protein
MDKKYTKYSSLTRITENPNEKIVPRLSIHDFDVSQIIHPSENYTTLKNTCPLPCTWTKQAGTFL